MKFGFIADQRLFYPLVLLCRVMRVSRSEFFDYLARRDKKPSKREQDSVTLRNQITDIFEASGKRYGSPRIYLERAKPAPLGLVRSIAVSTIGVRLTPTNSRLTLEHSSVGAVLAVRPENKAVIERLVRAGPYARSASFHCRPLRRT